MYGVCIWSPVAATFMKTAWFSSVQKGKYSTDSKHRLYLPSLLLVDTEVGFMAYTVQSAAVNTGVQISRA